MDLKKPDDYRLDLRKISKDLEEINQKLDYIKDQNTSILTKLLKDKVIQSSKEDFEIIDLLKDLKKNLMTSCPHNWKKKEGNDSLACYICNWYPAKPLRAKCLTCYKEACIKCLETLELIQKEEIIIKPLVSLEQTEVRILRKRIENLEDMQKLLISRIEQLEQLPTLPLSIPSTSQPHNFVEQDFIQVVCNTSQLKSLKLKCLIRIDTYHIGLLKGVY